MKSRPDLALFYPALIYTYHMALGVQVQWLGLVSHCWEVHLSHIPVPRCFTVRLLLKILASMTFYVSSSLRDIQLDFYIRKLLWTSQGRGSSTLQSSSLTDIFKITFLEMLGFFWSAHHRWVNLPGRTAVAAGWAIGVRPCCMDNWCSLASWGRHTWKKVYENVY